MKNIQEKKEEESRINGSKTELYQEHPGGQFKEGNPGRPPGNPNFKTDFDTAIKEIAELNNITESEAKQVLIKKAWSQAKDGDFPYYKDIMDRYYGRAPQPLIPPEGDGEFIIKWKSHERDNNTLPTKNVGKEPA